jgi:hypothetical protein
MDIRNDGGGRERGNLELLYMAINSHLRTFSLHIWGNAKLIQITFIIKTSQERNDDCSDTITDGPPMTIAKQCENKCRDGKANKGIP